MQQRRRALSVSLTASILLGGSCLGIQVPFLPFGNATNPTPAVLSRCEPNPSALCLLSFGIEPPDQMLITFFVPLGAPSDFYARVTYSKTRALYQCLTVHDFPTSHYCTGAQIPLGTSIGIELVATHGNASLAQGDFVLNGLAFPTPAGGSTSGSTSAAPTALNPFPAQTPTATFRAPSTVSPATLAPAYP